MKIWLKPTVAALYRQIFLDISTQGGALKPPWTQPTQPTLWRRSTSTSQCLVSHGRLGMGLGDFHAVRYLLNLSMSESISYPWFSSFIEYQTIEDCTRWMTWMFSWFPYKSISRGPFFWSCPGNCSNSLAIWGGSCCLDPHRVTWEADDHKDV